MFLICQSFVFDNIGALSPYSLLNIFFSDSNDTVINDYFPSY